ncbi:MAG: hypothetical protein M5U29_03440 [Anaerolineae bacterium]|nr:hypothetical protein [Anaerolineae bacterium]
MLKGLRWPFLALLLASTLLVVALIVRPDDSGETPPTAPTETALPTPQPTPHPPTRRPPPPACPLPSRFRRSLLRRATCWSRRWWAALSS